MRPVCIAILGVALMLAGQALGAPGSTRPLDIQAGGSVADSVGQLVFANRRHEPISETRVGDDLVMVPALLAPPSRGTSARGVISVESTARRTVVHLQHGALVQMTQAPGRVTLNVTAVAGPVGSGVLPGLPAPMIAVVDAPPVHPAPPLVGGSGTMSAAATPGVASVGPVSIEASLVQAAPLRPVGLLLPFDRMVGAAAFRRGDRLEIVFDSRKPLDLSSSATDPVFEKARLTLLPTATLLDMPFDATHPVSLNRVLDGWLLTTVPHATHVATPESSEDGFMFTMADASRVLTVPDPVDGSELLVGTVLTDARSVSAMGRTPGYRIIPTTLGVAIERISDRVELRRVANGFRLIDPFAPSGGYRTDATADFSRSIDFAAVDQAEQWRRYKAALANSASLAPGARRIPRLDAANAALARGMGRETRLLAQVADQDAPNAAGRSRSAFLKGAGALLAGDPDAARLLADPLVGNSDEAVLWRNLAIARQDPTDRAATRAIADLWRLLLSYPRPVKRLLLGDAALSMVDTGDDADRVLVVHLEDQTGKVGLARALAMKGPDHDKLALAMLDRLFGDRDPDVALSAAQDAIDLRLRDHLIEPAEAARRMEGLIYDGRMAGRETDVAIHAARLHAQAKNWPAALSILRQEARSYPDDLTGIKRAVGDILTQATDAPQGADSKAGTRASYDPLADVALLEQNQDLLPPDSDRVGLSMRLADRLMAHDQTGSATGFLQRAFDQSQPGPDKARLGLALARTLFQQEDVAGAGATLDTVDRAGLPPGLLEQAAVLHARLLVSDGDRKGAIAILAPLQGQDALAQRADMMRDEKDWHGEAMALSALLADRLPNGPNGQPLDPATEELVLRLAGSLSRSAQPDAVRQLDRTWSASFGDRSKRDMLSLLASPDVISIGDLSRSASDITTARSALKALDQGGRI